MNGWARRRQRLGFVCFMVIRWFPWVDYRNADGDACEGRNKGKWVAAEHLVGVSDRGPEGD